jgi:tetratricopeptide (TPR) repeat protein
MSKQKSAKQAVSPPVPSTITVSDAAAETASEQEAKRTTSITAKLRRAQSLIPVALAILTSLNTLSLTYAADDSQQVLGNLVIRSLKNLPLQFTSGVWSFVSIEMMAEQLYYRPLFGVLLTFDYALFGSRLWAWHLVNVLIHAAAAWLVYLVCKEFTGRPRIALIAASLFAVHPVHAESVAWISGITDPWMSLFFLTAFYTYLRYRKSGKPYLIIATLALFLLALFAKEAALALPVLIAYCELFYFGERDRKQRWLRLGVIAASFVVPLAVYLFMRRAALGSLLINGDTYESVGVVLLTMPIAVLKYLLLSTLTLGYSYQHFTPFVTSPANWRFLVPFVIVASLVVLFVFSKSRLVKFAAVWFAVTLLPALAAIRYFGPEYVVQDRYLYLPSIGFCLLVALGIEWLVARFPQAQSAKIELAIVSVLVLILGGVLIRQNLFWKDDVAVFQRCIAVDPTSAEAHSEMALIYFNTGNLRNADTEAKRALELNPQCANAYMRLSYFSAKLGKLDDAIKYMEQGIAAVPVTQASKANLATMHLNLGLLYSQKQNPQLAEEQLSQSRELRSRALGYYHSGLYYFLQKRYEEALPMYEEAQKRLPPGYAPIHLSMAVTYEMLEQNDSALAEYAKYLENAPVTASDRDKVISAMKKLQGEGKK